MIDLYCKKVKGSVQATCVGWNRVERGSEREHEPWQSRMEAWASLRSWCDFLMIR